MQMSKPIFILLSLLIPFWVCSQGLELSTKSKKAKKFYESGEQNMRIQDLDQAESDFLNAAKEDPEFYEAWVLLGDLYEQMNNDSAAIRSYTNAVDLNPDKFPPAFFILGNLEFENGLYSEALVHYQNYLSHGNAHGGNQIKAEKNIENCKFAIDAIANPVPFNPVNLGPNINSELNEYFPCLTADNETLLFTRLVEYARSSTGMQEDFYVSYFENDNWQPAFDIGFPINTNLNEGAPTLSADGNILIFTACESLDGYGQGRKGFGRCDLFVSKRSGNEWTFPYNLGEPVNSRHWESQASFSSDGRTLYFVSNRNKGYDIWVTRVNNNGEWSEPEMLGDNINTDGYEGSVFIHPDNQTLYFSSDGHVGMGKMDIFLSRKDSLGHWGKPVNLGYPINSHKDDNSILISADGELAMFASDRDEGFGGLDLYHFELYEEVRPKAVTYIKGTVFNAETKAKLEARFELSNLKTGDVAVESFSNRKTGEFLVCLPTNDDYALNVFKEGYLFYSDNFSLAGESSSSDPVLLEVPLNPLKVGEKVIMKNVFFDTDQYELLGTSMVELKNLISLLNNNPEMHIEISGHTDNVGTPEYNLSLSENRAKAVFDYLVQSGIDSSRLLYKGYGETQPLDTNDTETGRASNRRTEFKVVE